MLKKIILTSAVALVAMTAPVTVYASEGGQRIVKGDFSFEGPFGIYDKESLRRGLQVYRQVCSACHSLNRVAFRNLDSLGYTEDEIKAIAGEYTVTDGPNDDGEMFDRAARPSDHFKAPFANAKAAAAANGGAIPPDLSLITKARHGGADYVLSILTGYAAAPEHITVPEGKYYNAAMAGNVIAMPPPLTAGAVEYADGSPQTVEQYARDVSTFLTWAAEPEMEARKRMGVKVLLFLAAFAVIMYRVKKTVWKKVH